MQGSGRLGWEGTLCCEFLDLRRGRIVIFKLFFLRPFHSSKPLPFRHLPITRPRLLPHTPATRTPTHRRTRPAARVRRGRDTFVLVVWGLGFAFAGGDGAGDGAGGGV